jgi:hypothetical protein
MAKCQHNVTMDWKKRLSSYQWRGGLILGISLLLAYFSTAQPLIRAFQGAIYVGYSRNFIILTTIGIIVGLTILVVIPRLPQDMLTWPVQSGAVIPLLIYFIGLMFIGFGTSVLLRAILEGQGYRYF